MKVRGVQLWMTALILSAALVHGEIFKDGERVCFLGDSITNGGRYQGVIQNYYLTRFPEAVIRFINAGRSGDSAGGSLGRLQEDVIDFHTPMTAFNLEQQKREPGYTIVGPDRVHPGAPGLLMMAWLFLKEQGVSPLVSRVGVDAATQRVTAAENAAVTAVAVKEGGITFTVLAKALPLPVDGSARAILELLPVEKDLNQELLAVTGLAQGTYVLKIDGVEAGRYPAEELARGINLGFNPLTPQFKQAQAVAARTERYRSAELKGRDLLNTRRWMVSYYKIDVDDPAAVQAHYDHFEDKTSYSAIKALIYIKEWHNYQEYVKEAAALEKEMFANRAPLPQRYEIAPVS